MKAVIFDMYGVVIREEKGNLQPYISTHIPGITEDEVYRDWLEVSRGFITAEKFLSDMGLTGDLEAIQRDYLDRLHLDTDIYEICRRVRAAGMKTALLSNDVGSWNRYLRQKYSLDALFDVIIVSGDVGLRKPMPEIYRLTLEQLGELAQDCIFIDDQLRNLTAAQQEGIKTLHYHSDGQVHTLLRAANLLGV